MKRGFIRPTRRKPLAFQREALAIAKCRVVYEEQAGESWAAFVLALRAGDEVVVDGYDCIAANRIEGTERLRQLEAKGVALVDARSGEAASGASVALWAEACRIWAGDARAPTPAEAARRGRRGGRKPKPTPMPEIEAKEIWSDASISTAEALAKIGLSHRLAYRRLGPRGTPSGRPKVGRIKDDKRTSKIYFCQAGGSKGPVKIGISVEVDGRINALATNHHDDLRLLATINGDRKDEKALHRKFKQYHKRGEWFEFGPELAAYIKSLPKPKRRT